MPLHIGMITIDCADPRGLAAFWTEALGTTVMFDSDEFIMLAPSLDGGPRLGLQRVPEPRNGKNRAHIDLIAQDRAAEVQRVVALGATELGEHSVPGLTWTTLTDPVGNEFCISAPESAE